ncbi:PQQ-dependent sugar dehydrogenase [Dyadobacter subterraneus]|uniref:PQQ-dependent sugar dehydrogenase n=1 Tax=Dyadobacter subterraneus TaxID=2773304 RepID=A0ABR9WB20_9BACT|nr:PQQ-dependent sugar dehydrogenase [Dyadobacter subterraneus]MBE9462672.1 PQQ-dependent sugar dehydrogenase [Dyadobacter subterraneus]
MKFNTFTILLLLILGASAANAQRGMPPKAKTRSVLITKYPQHLDFLPAMVKLIKVPDGWQVSVAAAGLGKPRMLYNGPNGELYVTRRDAGDVLMLRDNDKNNTFEELTTVASEFKGVHGITIKDGFMYLCNNEQLRRYPLNPDGTLGETQILISDLPSGGQHPNRTIEFGPDGMLYLSVGATCNDCKESDKETATMLQVDPKTWKRTIYASGLRNTIGFDFQPKTGEMWGADNGGDGKGNKWPPEEINQIVKNGNYGFPFAYGKKEVDQSREDPAGDTKEEWVKNTLPSTLELPAHMAPIAFKFFGDAANIPTQYSGDALVAWHGSWNRSKPSGYKVQRIHFENGNAVGAEDFMTGFLKPGMLLFKRKTRFGRPAGITVTPSGVVYVSDDANGVIYAVKKTN